MRSKSSVSSIIIPPADTRKSVALKIIAYLNLINQNFNTVILINLMQCAAVNTTLAVIKDPPQSDIESANMYTCPGNCFTLAKLPPII
jgi:hypothetical protein